MKKEQLIVSVNIKNSLILESATSDISQKLGAVPKGCMRLSGVFGVTGFMNENKRFYTNENYKQMVETLNTRIQNEGVFGELEHPDNMNLNWDNVTHKVESISIDESTGVVSGTILLLNNTKGSDIQKLVENGLKLKISSRAKGVVSESGEVKMSHLETYDLVHRPGFPQAQLSITESLDRDGVLLFETVEYDIDSKNKVVESKINIDEIVKLVSENVLKSINSTEQKLDLSIIEKYCTDLVETKIDENNNKTSNLIHESMHKFGRATQNWVIKEFAPEIQNWNIKEFAPIVEQFFDKKINETKEWIANDYAQSNQDWLIKEFAPQIQGWCVNEFAPSIDTYFEEKFNESKKQVKEMCTDNETDSDNEEDEIDETKKKIVKEEDSEDSEDSDESDDENSEDETEVDESLQIKPNKSIVEQIDEELLAIGSLVKNEQKINESIVAINEDEVNAEKLLISNIPLSVKHLWESSDIETKSKIIEQSKLRDFVNESQMHKFWITRFNDIKTNKQNKLEVEGMLNESTSNSLISFTRMMMNK